jgi:allantoinase
LARVDLIIRGRRVYSRSARGPAAIHIAAGRIATIEPYDAPVTAPLFDAGDYPVLPGLVDSHVHINEPGRTEWDGYETATQSAAAGGETTLVDMPLNAIPATTSEGGLEAKQDAARGRCWVDVGLWGGVVPGNTAQLAGIAAGGALGFKCFLTPSGVAEFANVSEDDLREAAPELARLGATLLVHAEWPARLQPVGGDPLRYRNFLDSRPRASEHEAIARMIELSRAHGVRVHIVHLSSADALPMLRQARAEGLPVTVETCPHYLTFAAEDIPDGATEFKCAPPIRERENAARLWAALEDGAIDLVATDHSPCPPSMKAGDFSSAWGGIASLQLSLGVMWNHARTRGIGPERLIAWMSAAPARLAGLYGRKGAIAPGFDADIAIWNPDAEPAALLHRHKLIPYGPSQFPGAVVATFLRGEKIYEHGRFLGAPAGAILGPERFSLTESELLACCGSREWVGRMLAGQPFSGLGQMLEAEGMASGELTRSDWLAAFAAHPRIGAATTDARAAREQSGARDASAETLARLAAGNRAYEEKFGYIYIVCATGKSAAEMLAILESRLRNSPEAELAVAAEQQRRITRLRLERWLEDR